MAKNKKRNQKKSQSAHQGKVSTKMTKTHFDQGCAVSRKIFQMLDMDPELFNSFSKHQKQSLFRLEMHYPRFSAKEEHTVPKYYIKYVQSQIIYSLQKDMMYEPAGLTVMEMLLFGSAFFTSVKHTLDTTPLSEPHREIFETLNKRGDEHDILNEVFDRLAQYLRCVLMLISQPQYRIYGCDVELKAVRAPKIVAYYISIIAHDCQSAKFRHNNHERKGYLLAVGKTFDQKLQPTQIALGKLFPNTTRPTLMLDIYVQAHAMHRFKERVDTLEPIMRNQMLVISLMCVRRVVQDANGNTLIACVQPANSQTAPVIGYFTFMTTDNKLLVLTFLPLLAPTTPEGKIVCDRLKLGIEDMQYLGMDKLSFFYDVDIDRIPALKRVLYDECKLDYIRTLHNFNRDESRETLFDEKKTQFVKDFFRKNEAYEVEYVSEE